MSYCQSIDIVVSVGRLFTETMMSIDNKTPKSFILTVVFRSSCEILENPSFLSHLYSLSLAKQIWCPGGSVPWCNVYLILTYSMEVTIVKFTSLDLVNTFIKIMLLRPSSVLHFKLVVAHKRHDIYSVKNM